MQAMLILFLEISKLGIRVPSSETKTILGALVATANIVLKSVFDQAVCTDYSGARDKCKSKKYDIQIQILKFMIF